MKGSKFLFWLAVGCSVVTVIFLFIDMSIFLAGLLDSAAEWAVVYFCCYLPAKAKARQYEIEKQIRNDRILNDDVEELDETEDKE